MNCKIAMIAGARVRILKTDNGPTQNFKTPSLYKSCQKSPKVERKKN